MGEVRNEFHIEVNEEATAVNEIYIRGDIWYAYFYSKHVVEGTLGLGTRKHNSKQWRTCALRASLFEGTVGRRRIHGKLAACRLSCNQAMQYSHATLVYIAHTDNHTYVHKFRLSQSC